MLRLLFARIGVPHCPNCGKGITAQTVQQIVDAVLGLGEGTRIAVLAPIVLGILQRMKGAFGFRRRTAK